MSNRDGFMGALRKAFVGREIPEQEEFVLLMADLAETWYAPAGQVKLAGSLVGCSIKPGKPILLTLSLGNFPDNVISLARLGMATEESGSEPSVTIYGDQLDLVTAVEAAAKSVVGQGELDGVSVSYSVGDSGD